jgi:hypothetical protein
MMSDKNTLKIYYSMSLRFILRECAGKDHSTMTSSTKPAPLLFIPPWDYPHVQPSVANVLASRAAATAQLATRRAFDTSTSQIVEVSDIASNRTSPVPQSAMAIDDRSSSSSSSTTSSDGDDDDEMHTALSASTPRDASERVTLSSDADSHTTTNGSSNVSTPRDPSNAKQHQPSSIGAAPLLTSGASDTPGVDLQAKVDPFASEMWQNTKLVQHNNETLLGYLRGGAHSYQESALHNATWCGFGPIMRPKMWAVRLSFALSEQVDLLELVTHRGLDHHDYTEIMKDVPRTYTSLDELPPPCLAARRQLQPIYRLLCAMASYNRAIGYAQSMNRLAMVLIDVFTEPWQQFWALDYLITRILPHYFMRNSSIGLLVDIAVLAYYIRRRDRELSLALSRHDDIVTQVPNMVLYTLCAQWLSPLFVGTMRFGNVLRLWDAIIMHGAAALFTFVYRVLAFNRAAIIAAQDMTDIVAHMKQWLEQLETLDVLASVKMDKPIDNADVDARRAAQLTALMNARPGERNFHKKVSCTRIDGYANFGRGCMCASNEVLTRATTSSSVDTPPSAATGPFVGTATTTPLTSNTMREHPAPKRGASLPRWASHRSIDESLLIGANDHSSMTLTDDGDDDGSFTTVTMPLAAPLRGTSAAITRQKRSGVRVASSNTTIGSLVPARDDKSNGTDG